MFTTQAAILHQQAAELAGAADSRLHDKALYLDSAGDCFCFAALEAQEEKPRQKIINLFTQAASLNKEAVEAEDSHFHHKALYLHKAGCALLEAAHEAKKPDPKQDSIDFFIKSARFKKEAVEAQAHGLHDKASYLHTAEVYFLEAAQEAQKFQPDTQRIERLSLLAKEYEGRAYKNNAASQVQHEHQAS